ncbi:MAG: PP2C family protein-serine/threonine phosphatase, partial [Terracidiphilus sp.]
RMNQHHWTEGEEARRRYVTAIFLRLHTETGEVEVVNAGHNPGFMVEPDGRICEFESTGTPLGLLPGMRYTSQKTGFTPGARLLFYTDGLTEVFRGEEEFGPERLIDVFSKCRVDKADDILGAIWTAIEEFAEGGPQGDDMTALALCRGAV